MCRNHEQTEQAERNVCWDLSVALTVVWNKAVNGITGLPLKAGGYKVVFGLSLVPL